MKTNNEILEDLNKNTQLDFRIDVSLRKSVYFESKYVIISKYDGDNTLYCRTYHSHDIVKMNVLDYDVINDTAKKGMLLAIDNLKSKIAEIEFDLDKLK